MGMQLRNRSYVTEMAYDDSDEREETGMRELTEDVRLAEASAAGASMPV